MTSPPGLVPAQRRRAFGRVAAACFASLAGGTALSACGGPAPPHRVVLNKEELEAETGLKITHGPTGGEVQPGLVLSEARGEQGLAVVQAVALLADEKSAEERLAETVKANQASRERAELPSPGPPGSDAFAIHLEYSAGVPVKDSPFVMVAARRGRYSLRVEVLKGTQAQSLELAGKLIRKLIDRAK